mgnify:CR=1 FL=1
MTSANGRKPKYTGEFEIWGTDACRNYDYCGGRITLFVANKKCISCDPESYKKREALPDDSANERKQLSELVRDFLLKYHDSKVRDDDDLEMVEINDTIESLPNGVIGALTEGLPARKALAIKLRYVENQVHVAIGEALGVSKQRSDQMLDEAIEKMRHKKDLLEELSDTFKIYPN